MSPRGRGYKDATVAKQVLDFFDNTCSRCDRPSGAEPKLETDGLERGTSIWQRRRLWLEDLEQHGAEDVRKRWRLICRGCTQARKTGAGWVNRVEARAVFERIFNRQCGECGKTPKLIRSLLIIGPGDSTNKERGGRLSKFIKLLTIEGEAAAKKTYKALCRRCFNKAGMNRAA